MSWHFSQALAAACLPLVCWGGEPSVQLKLNNSALTEFCNDKTKGTWDRFQYGTTFIPFKGDLGGEKLISFLVDFLVKPSVLQPTEIQPQLICGLKCEGWSTKFVQISYS